MNRRDFCKAAVSATAGLVGAASATATSAHSRSRFAGTVSTRGQFTIETQLWNVSDGFQDEVLGDCYNRYAYSVEGIPGVSVEADPECSTAELVGTSDQPEDLVVMIHGYNNSRSVAREVFEKLAESLGKNGYGQPVVGYQWDADRDSEFGDQLSWWDTEDIADRNGSRLAAFVDDYLSATDDTGVRLVAHSLGARVLLSALDELRGGGRTDGIRSATVLGAAVPANIATEGGRYYEAAREVPDQFTNYYKDDDEVLTGQYNIAELLDWAVPFALGQKGAKGHPPENYTEFDVTETVADHEAYYRPGGCVDRVVENW